MQMSKKQFINVFEFVTIMATCQEKSKEATMLHVLSTLARFEKQSLKQCTLEARNAVLMETFLCLF